MVDVIVINIAWKFVRVIVTNVTCKSFVFPEKVTWRLAYLMDWNNKASKENTTELSVKNNLYSSKYFHDNEGLLMSMYSKFYRFILVKMYP